jgi:hypothetical protein
MVPGILGPLICVIFSVIRLLATVIAPSSGMLFVRPQRGRSLLGAFLTVVFSDSVARLTTNDRD